jgi:DNA-binding NarL/FixJ family response regulator
MKNCVSGVEDTRLKYQRYKAALNSDDSVARSRAASTAPVSERLRDPRAGPPRISPGGSYHVELVSVLELAYFEGLSCSEIAARLDLPIGTVKSRMARALSQLRQAVGFAESGEQA